MKTGKVSDVGKQHEKQLPALPHTSADAKATAALRTLALKTADKSVRGDINGGRLPSGSVDGTRSRFPSAECRIERRELAVLLDRMPNVAAPF
ncbi:MAG: hypothetical protein J6336_08710, partial [Kiritimatiellae bacterium]|nr:hypothetical protein [Kiritimatiellia bacterium]